MRAFSLVELSIVLVILGLLTGGVLAGQALIQSAKLRRQVMLHDHINTAIFSFREKYGTLPGDLDKATAFWPSTPAADGNGNGRITQNNAYMLWVQFTGEVAQFWVHLNQAGMFNLLADTGDGNGAIGVDFPENPVRPGTGLVAVAAHEITALESHYYQQPPHDQLRYKNLVLWLNVAQNIAAGNRSISNASKTPFPSLLAWQMDTKMDDGLPVSGRLIAPATYGNASGIEDNYYNNRCSNKAANQYINLNGNYDSMGGSSTCFLVYGIF